jgi:protein-tyrosine phosphatase
MVCLGNICRSPLAEGILKSKLPLDRFSVESAGTAGYHIGRAPDSRSIEVAAENGIDISSQKARKFSPDDFDRFDKIFVMDRSNLRNVKQMALTPEDQNKVTLLLENVEVPDPYYGNENGFKKVFDLIDQACEQLSDTLQKTRS